jgi:hypothetical protein
MGFRVGILTFHEGLNHGAFLQAYCLVIALRKLGHEPVLVNYKNSRHWLKENVHPWFSFRRPVRFLDQARKLRAFRKDQASFPLSPYTRDADVVRQQAYDVLLVGSDTVWDTNIFGYDPLYFGDLQAGRRVAYAASCGTLNAASPLPDGVREQLLAFDAISVLDPVFLPQSLDGISGMQDPPSGPFVLVYGARFSKEDATIIRRVARVRNLPVYSVGSRNFFADRSFLGVGPLSVLSWFRSAELVFSATFHGAIMAIRSHKPFGVRLHDPIRNKVSSLLKDLGLPERAAPSLRALEETLNAPIDFIEVDRRVESGRQQSIAFLREALSLVEGVMDMRVAARNSGRRAPGRETGFPCGLVLDHGPSSATRRRGTAYCLSCHQGGLA